MRTNAVFSFSPVKAAALRSISSSMFNVDLIHINMRIECTRVKSPHNYTKFLLTAIADDKDTQLFELQS
jgi:hypothetical protein